MGQIKLCHHPPQSTSTYHQPEYIHHHPIPSTTNHHQPKYIHHHPLPPTTIHHHPQPAKIYPPLPATSQKMDHHPTKVEVYSYISSFWQCFNSFFFFKIQYSFPWRRFCVTNFWSVCFPNSKFVLHSEAATKGVL